MGRPYQILLPLFSLFLVRVDLTDLHPLKIPVQVLRIYDGDTLLVKHGNYLQKLRISKIDAPEKRQGFLLVQGDAGLYSQKCLEKWVGQKTGSMSLEGYDIYGRMLGDYEEVSLRMIENGCAGLYPYGSFSSRAKKAEYLRGYFSAKRRRVGLWSFGGIRQPKEWRKKNKKSFSKRT